jgi:hypothetical protein
MIYCQNTFQHKDSIQKAVDTKNPDYKPEFLTSGFIDVINNGQLNASARLIRLYLGEPGKFVIPISLYSGVSSNNFQNQLVSGGPRPNEQLANNFINPLGGLANVSLEGTLFLPHKRSEITAMGFLYHTGIRVLTGFKVGNLSDPSTGKPVNFLNGFASGGMYFQTGAWERNNARNMGVCWIAGRYIFCKSGEAQLQNFLTNISTNGFYHGWSAAWGIEINGLVNVKVIYYKYVKAPEINFSQSIYQFSFSYSLK